MGKTDKRRPCQTTRAEEELRWALASGKIKFAEYEQRYKILFKKGQIKRGGKVIK